MSKKKPRAYTKKEMQKMFLKQLEAIKQDCINGVRRGANSWEEAIDLAIFSTLVVFDGESVLPSMDLIPTPCSDDKDYYIKVGENYWPENVNIAGLLHDQWCNKERNEPKRKKTSR